MTLFREDSKANLLPYDGLAEYHGPVCSPTEAQVHYEALRNGIAWRHDEVVMFGKRVVTAREVAWYAESGLSYTYSGATKRGLPWTTELRILKDLVETVTGATFNCCLLNLYHDGEQGMGWHSDDEKSLVKNGTIASLSFGAERKFSFKHKVSAETIAVTLASGSLLVMRNETQTHWLHCLPKTKKIREPRINLTFRTMLAQGNPLRGSEKQSVIG
jgi:alkylated DNA repair dioxygenase AlkB